MTRRPTLAARAGRWSATHRRTAILGWIAFVVVAVVLGGAIGTKQLDDIDAGTGESNRADRVLDAAFPADTQETVLVQGDGDARAVLRDVTATLRGFDDVRDVQRGATSADGRSHLVTFALPGEDDDAAQEAVGPIAAAVERVEREHPGFRVDQFGGASAGAALDARVEEDFQRAELLSLPITLLILVVAFGALVAAGLPVLLALSGVGASLGLLALPSQLLPVDESIGSVVLLIGMAVGVDYSLFYLRREREEREKGASTQEAVATAAATSGHAVLVSGLTVIAAMAGMFLTGHQVFTSFAMGTIIVVAVAMVGSMTVLPAMLAALGPKVDRGRIPFLGRRRRREGGGGRVMTAILGPVLRRPLVATVAASALLVALAIPALGLNTATSSVDDLPRDLPVMQAYDRIQAAFPGDQIPAVVAVQAEDVTAPPVRAGLERLAAGTRDWGPASIEVSDDRRVASVSIPMPGTGADDASEAALERLRERVVPETIGAVPGVTAATTGFTAGSVDFTDQMSRTMPLVFAFVLALAFVLLLVTFRSVVVPLKAIALNLLSVGAAYGVLVLVFQEGVGAELLGLDEAQLGTITSWLPMFLFVILFGLSMDYHVFILSRIREAVDGGMDTRAAVAHGIRATAGVVTSAAVVMVGVFSVFGTLSMVEMKQMGVGLAVAVLLDATIIRAVLLPATMTLLGERNWWLPGFLRDRLPQPARATA
jgi:uncharacterized membrane protein YdfJ with MMPL/SSD domain